MRPYIVRQGDYLTKLAHAMGFDAEVVWNDPKNADLKSRRPDHELLCAGDILFVPESRREGLPIQKGVTNRYVARIPKVPVKIILQCEGRPHAAVPYVIEGLGDALEGKTGEDGGVTFEAPIHVREVQIVLPESNLAYPVLIGDLDPVEEISGIRMRLAHLGHYGWYPPSEPDEEQHRAAIAAFQSARGLDTTGILDDATRDALRTTHQI